jgi:hypothetical protein
MTKTELINKLDQLDVKYCFNEQEYSNDKLKFIIVGDNPGKTEYETKRFFIGKSGQDLRNHFRQKNLVSDFDLECLIRNKTFIHTIATSDLETIRISIGTNVFDEIIENCVNEIAEISNKYNLPILIFGKSKIGPNLLFDKFWQLINQKASLTNILVFSHPAYSRFEQEWNRYSNNLTYSSNIDLLKKIGEKNTELINKKYNKIMRKRFFYGAQTHNTWPKLFVLTDDGKFYCEYLDYMKPARVQKNFDFDTFKAEDYEWDGYQTIVEIDESSAKSKMLKSQSNWISRYLDSL